MLENILIMAHQDAVFSKTPKGVHEPKQGGGGFLAALAAVADEQNVGFSSHGDLVRKKGENAKDEKGPVVSGKAVKDSKDLYQSEAKSVKAKSVKAGFDKDKEEEIPASDGEAVTSTVNPMVEDPEQAILPGLMTPLLSEQNANENVSVSEESETEINFLNTPKKKSIETGRITLSMKGQGGRPITMPLNVEKKLSSELPIKENFKVTGESTVGVEVDKLSLGKNDVQAFQESELKKQNSPEKGVKLSDKAQALSPQPSVEKKSGSSTPGSVSGSKTPLKAGVTPPVGDVRLSGNGKVVVEKTEIGSSHESELKKQNSPEKGTKLSDKAQTLSPQPSVEKKSGSSTPGSVSGSKTPLKAGVTPPVGDVRLSGNGKVVVEKTEIGSSHESELKKQDSPEKGVKLSDKAQALSPQPSVEKKSGSSTPGSVSGSKTPLKSGVTPPVGDVRLSGNGKVVVEKTEIGSSHESELKKQDSPEKGVKLSDKAQALSPQPSVEKKSGSSTPGSVSGSKTPLKSGVTPPVGDVRLSGNGKVVVEKTEIGSSHESELKKQNSPEKGTKLSDKAQALSPQPSVEKKSGSSTPGSVSGSKTALKSGVTPPVGDVRLSGNGKVVVEKTEIGSSHESELKKQNSPEKGTKLSDKAQALSPQPSVEKKSGSSTPGSVSGSKTALKAGVTPPVGDVRLSGNGKVVVEKTEIGSSHESELKKQNSPEKGTKLSDKAQALSPQPSVEKKSGSSTPGSVSGSKTALKAGVTPPVGDVRLSGNGKVVVEKTEIGSSHESELKKQNSPEKGTKLSDKAQALSPQPSVEKKSGSSTPGSVSGSKTALKAGVTPPVGDVRLSGNGKVVVEKSEIGSSHESELKKQNSPEKGVKLSDKAQTLSPQPSVEKKSGSSTPGSLSASKTPLKVGVTPPVGDVRLSGNGKVVVEKAEIGSSHESELKKQNSPEKNVKLSDKAQALSPQPSVDKKEPSATPDLAPDTTKNTGKILNGSGKSSSAEKENPLFSDSFRVIRSGAGEVSMTEKGDKGQKELSDGFKANIDGTAGALESETQSSKSNTEQREGQAESEKSNQFQGKISHDFSEKLESTRGEDTPVTPKTYAISDNSNTIVAPDNEKELPKRSNGTDGFGQVFRTAAFLLKNGRSEVKMSLHPESLGHLRIRVLTESHQVTVKVMAETMVVKEMIENNLHQLKADFQNQGLEIEKFIVSVSQDSDKSGAGYNPSQGHRTKGRAGQKREGNGRQDEKFGRAGETSKAMRHENAVDFFA